MKDTKILDYISNSFTSSTFIHSFLFNFLTNNSFASIISDCRAKYCRKQIMSGLILSKILQFDSIHQLLNSDLKELFSFGKDVMYSIKNNAKNNWRACLWNQVKKVVAQVDYDLKAKNPHEVPCFIIDDSDLPKRGKFAEFVGRIFSHVDHKYNLGFKSLNLAYWTGKTIFHLDFSFHIELGKKGTQGLNKKELNQRYSKKRSPEAHGSVRVAECTKKKTQILLQMLKRAISKGIEARYVLVDSWFFNQALLQFVGQQDIDLITRPKFNNWKYEYNNKLKFR